MRLKRRTEPLSRPCGCWIEKKIIPIKDKKTVFEGIQEARCSECKSYFRAAFVYDSVHYNYCPNCGAKMKKEKSIW